MPRAQRPLWRIAALLSLLVLVLAACGSDKKETSTTDTTEESGGGGGGGGKCDGLAIGFFGALTGDAANLGINERNGAKLAIEQFNEKNPDCNIKLEEFDSAGDPAQAPALAQKAVGDKSVVAIVGPAFSGESKTANPIFDEAGVPIITASASNPGLSKNGWKIFHRAIGNDNAQGPAAANYIKTDLAAKKVAVIDDASEYGKGVADIVRSKLGSLVTVSDTVDAKGTDFSSTVNKIKSANADTVFYGGYYQQAGIMVKQMRDAGLKATFVAPDGSNDPGFIKAAGAASEGAILTAPAIPTEKIEGGQAFIDAYKKSAGQDVGLYSTEAYDAANAILDAITNGATTREAINEYLGTKTAWKGLTKTLKWGPDGELAGEVTIYAYKVESGKIIGLKAIKG